MNISLEANPGSYLNLKRNRPNSINICSALCTDVQTMHYIDSGHVETRGVLELMSPEFLKLWNPEVYYNITPIEDLMLIHCLPMKSLLRELSISCLDIWILDVEGAEESVLKVFPIPPLNQDISFTHHHMSCPLIGHWLSSCWNQNDHNGDGPSTNKESSTPCHFGR